MKNFKVLKKILLFALLGLLIFALFSSGGCGGGSSRNISLNNNQNDDEDDELDVGISGDVPAKTNDDPEVLRVLDKVLATDENGVPLIFDYAPLPESSDNSQTETGTPINFLKYVSSKDLNENGEFVKTFGLEKNNEYIIKYSHSSRNLNGAYLKFRITAPEDQIMILDTIGGQEKSSEDKELEDAGVISKSIYVETKHEIIPEEAPCIMIYSFKAPLTGNYEFAVRETTPLNLISPDINKENSYEFPFEFRFYTAGETYSATDDEEKELSARKTLDLQRVLLNNATEFDENGLPITFKSNDEYGSDEEITNNYFDSAYSVLDEVYGDSNSNSGKVIIAPRIDNIPYDPIYVAGSGFYAHSGLRSVQLTALDDSMFSDNVLEDFEIDKPVGNTQTLTHITVDYATTDEEFYRLMKLDNINDFVLLRNALDNKTRERAQLGLAGTKTLFLRSERCENQPRMPELKNFRVRKDVAKALRKDFKSFQREHGDYFVAGYTYGMFYEAAIEIKAEPYNCYYKSVLKHTYYNDAEAICEYIAASLKKAFEEGFIFNRGKMWVSLIEIAESLKDARNVSVSVTYVKRSGLGKAVSSLTDLAYDYDEYRKQSADASSSDLERLYVTLIRYRELERLKKYIPEELPITEEHYELIRKLNKIIYITRCYKNAVDSIPAYHLNNGEKRREEWDYEFSNVFTLYSNQLNKLCSDINFVKEYYDNFSRLLDKYQGLNHRYIFYRYFVAFQKSVPNGVADWKDSDEKWSYPRFKVGFSQDDVANNKFIKEDFKNSDHTNDNFGFRIDVKWYQEGSSWERGGTYPEGYRIYYYEGGPKDTNKSSGTDRNGHSFGKRNFQWKFEGSGIRDTYIDVHSWAINMPVSTYPFVELED